VWLCSVATKPCGQRIRSDLESVSNNLFSDLLVVTAWHPDILASIARGAGCFPTQHDSGCAAETESVELLVRPEGRATVCLY
jgi:hypothetical protein